MKIQVICDQCKGSEFVKNEDDEWRCEKCGGMIVELLPAEPEKSKS